LYVAIAAAGDDKNVVDRSYFTLYDVLFIYSHLKSVHIRMQEVFFISIKE